MLYEAPMLYEAINSLWVSTLSSLLMISSFWGIVNVACSCCWQCFVYLFCYLQYFVYSSVDVWSHYNSSVGSVRFLVTQGKVTELDTDGETSGHRTTFKCLIMRYWIEGILLRIIISLPFLAVQYFIQLQCKQHVCWKKWI